MSTRDDIEAALELLEKTTHPGNKFGRGVTELRRIVEATKWTEDGHPITLTADERADLAAFVNWADGEIGAGRHLCDDPSDSEPVQQIERGYEIAHRLSKDPPTQPS